jgi:hypothetical protein
LSAFKSMRKVEMTKPAIPSVGQWCCSL